MVLGFCTPSHHWRGVFSERDLVSDSQIASVLVNSGVYAAIINACCSAKPSTTSLSNLAKTLIFEGVPSVIVNSNVLQGNGVGVEVFMKAFCEGLLMDAQHALDIVDAENKVLFLYGQAGYGKTVLLRDCEKWWLDSGWINGTIYIDLTEYSSKKYQGDSGKVP